jgi:hypothetical protein
MSSLASAVQPAIAAAALPGRIPEAGRPTGSLPGAAIPAAGVELNEGVHRYL